MIQLLKSIGWQLSRVSMSEERLGKLATNSGHKLTRKLPSALPSDGMYNILYLV